MADNFSTYQKGLDSPADLGTTITPADGADLAAIPRGIYVGFTGDVSCRFNGSSADVLLKAMPVGFYPFRLKRIYNTNTTATNLVAIE